MRDDDRDQPGIMAARREPCGSVEAAADRAVRRAPRHRTVTVGTTDMPGPIGNVVGPAVDDDLDGMRWTTLM